MVVELDLIADSAAGVSEALEALAMHALLFQGPDQTLHHAVRLWAVRRDEFLAQAVAAHESSVLARREHQPVIAAKKERRLDAAERSEAGMSACSSAAPAVDALPERESCQPRSSRLWQSMTRASVVQPSVPTQTRARSVDQRSFVAVVTEGSASIRGRAPTGRLRTCQPLSRKIRCTVVRRGTRTSDATRLVPAGPTTFLWGLYT